MTAQPSGQPFANDGLRFLDELRFRQEVEVSHGRRHPRDSVIKRRVLLGSLFESFEQDDWIIDLHYQDVVIWAALGHPKLLQGSERPRETVLEYADDDVPVLHEPAPSALWPAKSVMTSFSRRVSCPL